MLASIPSFEIRAFTPVMICAVLKCIRLGTKGVYPQKWRGGNHKELEKYPK